MIVYTTDPASENSWLFCCN